jgi:hypothetical protein
MAHSKVTQAALDKFKEEVKAVALRYAEENGWCDAIYDALEELGIEVGAEKYHVTIELNFDQRDGDEMPLGRTGDSLDSFMTDTLRGQYRWNSNFPMIVDVKKVK